MVLSVAMLMVAIAPQFALASWWNPSTWFSSQAPVVQTQISVPVAPVNVDAVVQATTTPPPVIQEKTVEKIVKISDPAQTQTISELNAQVASLTQQLQTQKTQYDQLLNTHSQWITAYTDLATKYNNLGTNSVSTNLCADYMYKAYNAGKTSTPVPVITQPSFSQCQINSGFNGGMTSYVTCN